MLREECQKGSEPSAGVDPNLSKGLGLNMDFKLPFPSERKEYDDGPATCTSLISNE